MKKLHTTNRLLSLLLAMVMVMQWIPLSVFAAEPETLCAHHPVHTAECGYAEAAEARPCTHTHDESCGFTEGVEGIPCACEATDENGAIVHTEGCGYVAAIPAADCTHEHDDTCGYAEAVMAHECHYICTECLADDVTEDTPECTCDSDDPDWHAPFCALYEMPEDPECFCTELCDPDQPNEWCDVCYFDADACMGSDEEQATGYAASTYIASLGIAQDADKADAINELSGHTVIDQDLNKGCGSSSDYIYMGYKTTTDPSEAITGIFIRTGENPPASATFDGVTAYLVGGSYEANTGVDNVVDLNEDAGGAYIYVYVTRDTSRAPVTEITFSSSNSKSGYTTPNVDLNQGVGGSDDIYLHYKQYSATAYINYYYLGENFEVVHKQVSGTLKHHLDQMTNTPSGASDVIYDGKTAAKIGWREDASVQNQGSSLTTPSVTLETSGKNYYAAYRLSFASTTSLTFDANGGSGAPNNLVRTNDTRYVTAGNSAFIIEKMSFTIPTTAPTHADKCKFLGWSTNKNATTAAYKSGETIQVDLNTTLYAVYQKTHSYNQNGFCTECGGYQPAVLNSDGYYEIGNGGQLFWFANYINHVDRTANAILIDDIDLEDRPWTPIGSTGENSNNFRGHFNGDGHTIEGLYVEGGRAGVGFFGEVRTGTVENFTIYGEVVMDKEYDYVGGVIGSACGLNSNQPDHNGATIRNITSYVNLTAKAHGIGMVGGFIGYANHETLIENCAWYGTFDAGIYRVDSGAGGFIGRIYDTATVTIRNCAAYGTVKTAYQSGTGNSGETTIYIGGFLSYSPSGAKTVLQNNLWAGQIINNTNLDAANAHLSAYGTMNSEATTTNCYALEGTPYVTTGNDNAGGITTVTAAQLASGEIAYKLGSAWGQNLGENGDAYPVLGGETVYEVKDCKDKLVGYSNSEGEKAHDFDDNGFCTVCGGYEPAVLNADGVYEISNAGQLYWFAQQVNGGDKGINGKLMENITVNENVLDANGELNSNSGSFRVWTPIGKSGSGYTGTFDGAGFTVSGLYFNDSATNYVGLFGNVYDDGTVQNVGVIDSYLYGNKYVGGVVGSNSGTVEKCYNTGAVSGSSESVGGIAGWNYGTVEKCYNTGAVSGSGESVGGVVGYNNYGAVKNCYNTGAVRSSGDEVGGVVGYSYKGTITDCYNTGAVSGGDYYVGGVVGYNYNGTVTDCYNTGDVSGDNYEVGGVIGVNYNGTITDCYNTGDVSGSNWVGGVVGSNSGTVEKCYNTGAVSGGSEVGGVVGYNNYGTVKDCYNTGAVSGSGDSVSGVVGYNNYGTVENCYYLNTAASGGINGADAEGQAEAKTTEAFASGEVAYLLQGEQTEPVWGQTIGTEDHPVLGGAKVYKNTCVDNIIYKNVDKDYTEHTNVGGFCAVCGKMLCDHSGNENKYDCTKDFVCSDCSAVITPAAEAHTPGEDDGDCATAVECTVCGTAVVAAKPHAFDSDGKCTNDGCTAIGYMLWVGGEQVTSKNLTITDENGGTATYDPANNILTLDNYTYEGAGYTAVIEEGSYMTIRHTGAVWSGLTDTLTIMLVGENSIRLQSEQYNHYGIYHSGSLVIKGAADSSLTTQSAQATGSSYGIFAMGDITIQSGDITAGGGKAEDVFQSSNGVKSGHGSITVTGGTLTAFGAEGSFSRSGLYTSVNLVMGEGIGILTPVGGYFDANERAVVDADSNVAAEVKIGAGYAVAVNTANGTVSGAGFYAEGAEVTLTITPNEGYLFESLTVDGEDVTTAVQNGTYTFTMPAKAVAVTATFVQAVTKYDLWVGGEQVTSENLVISGTTGTATYDPTANTLTLDSYSYTGAGYKDTAIYYGGSDTLELVLVNDNSVTHVGSSNLSFGIYADNGSIKISGDGKLTATGSEPHDGDSSSCGIRASKDITILSGTVTATGSKAAGDHSSDSTGIFAQGQITITGGTVTATASEVSGGYSGSSTGIYAYKGIHISGGTVEATGGTAIAHDSYGVSTYGSLTVSGGSLSATGGNVTGDDCCSYGVYAYDGLTMGTGYGIVTPVGGKFDGSQWAVVDARGQIAKEVVIDKGYTVSVNAAANGTVSGAGLYAEGTKVKLTVTPNYGYGLESLTVMQGETKIEVSNNSFTMPAGNVTVTATFVEATPYEIWIGGTQVTSANAADVFGDGRVSFTYSQKGEPSVLTLNNYTYEGEGYLFDTENYYGDHRAAICYLEMHPLTLALNGDSTITRTDGAAGRSYGIYIGLTTAELTVTGTGSLTVSGGAAEHYSYGVYTDSGLTINSGSLTVNGGDVTNEYEGTSYGLFMNYGGGLTVNGGSLTVNGGDVTGEYGSSFGMYVPNGITVNGGSLTANGGTAGLNSYAVQTYELTMGEGFGILTPVGGRYDGQDTVDDAAGEPAKTVVIGAGHTVTAAFAGIDGKDVGGTVTGTGFYKAGANVTLTITPDTGCSFVSLTMNDTDVTDQVENGQYTFTMPAGNVTITVTMERLFTPYDLWVGGEQFTDKNLTISGTTGTATYDPANNTLTLDGYTYEGAGHTWEVYYEVGDSDKYGAAIYYGGTEPLNLILKGKNTVAHAGSGYGFSYGLFSEDDIVVSEDSTGGSLTVTAGTAERSSRGVYTDETIQVESGSLTGIGGEAKTDYSYGVFANNGITVSGGSLTGEGGAATSGSSLGVYANYNSIKISGDGILTGTGGKAKNFSQGVYVDGLLEVSGGTLTGTGGASGYCSYGVDAYVGITVSGGSLTGIGGTAETCDSVGVRTGYYSGIKVTGGSLSGTGGTAGSLSTAVYTSSLDMSEGVSILIPAGGSFDADQHLVVDTDNQIATEVKIAEKPVVEYDLWVGGEQFTDKKLIISGTTGTATYDPDKNTLTLNGYSCTSDYTGYDAGMFFGAAIRYDGTELLKLVLVNDSTVTHTGGASIQGEQVDSHGVYATYGGIEISGDGSLTATGGATTYGNSYGIYANNLEILSGTVIAVGGKPVEGESCGIRTGREITINGGTVKATGGEAEADSNSYGIKTGDTVLIKNGTVEATGGTANFSYGINTENGSITISGGTVEATGGQAKYNSYGAYATYGITVSGSGSLIATGGAADVESYGIACWYDGHIAINGGTVEAASEYSAFTTAPTIADTLAVYDKDGKVIDNPVWTGTGSLTYAKIAEKLGHVHDFTGDGICVCGEKGIRIRGSSLSLEGNIGLKLYFSIDESIFDDASIKLTLADGRTFSYKASEGTVNTTAIAGETLYVFNAEVYAKQMADSVTIETMVGTNPVESNVHSVRDYAEVILANTDTYGEKMADLAKAMVNYGAAAQVNFGYNTDDLANAGYEQQLTDEEKAAIAAVFEAARVGGNKIEGIGTFAGSNLVLESETTLKVYFQPADGVNIEDLTFTVNGGDVDPVQAGQYYVIAIPNIASTELDDVFTIKVSDGTKEGTFATSVFAYCHVVVNRLPDSYTDALKDTLRALYIYNQAANSYFEAK